MSAEDDARLLIAQARDMGVGHQTGTVEVYRSWMTRVADVIEALLESADPVRWPEVRWPPSLP